MRKQLGVCVGVCRATKVTIVINLLYSCCLFDITYWWSHPEKQLPCCGRWTNPYHPYLPLPLSLSLLEINNIAIWHSNAIELSTMIHHSFCLTFPLSCYIVSAFLYTWLIYQTKLGHLNSSTNPFILHLHPLLTSFSKSQKWNLPFPPVKSNPSTWALKYILSYFFPGIGYTLSPL